MAPRLKVVDLTALLAVRPVVVLMVLPMVLLPALIAGTFIIPSLPSWPRWIRMATASSLPTKSPTPPSPC
jgi:hypothetical protein